MWRTNFSMQYVHKAINVNNLRFLDPICKDLQLRTSVLTYFETLLIQFAKSALTLKPLKFSAHFSMALCGFLFICASISGKKIKYL